jgi:hypothetical protein
MDSTIATIFDLYRDTHRQLRSNLEGLEPGALNWTPGPDTSSITALVLHSLGAEGEVFRIVRGRSTDRVREVEFQRQVSDSAELLARLDEADALLEESASGITADDLRGPRSRPGRPPRSGHFWLVRTFGHVREHLAHLELTKQLYQQRGGG